ncbi:type IV pilus modification protein PilV [Thalassomonas haliotis]|uniref:Type IV pilus modification protein PilV n=1 Tax=Thalassomonas haliotis TaxID=485448 RepID=A0ABY7VC79_9GAMM|nr:type IV pilus modification protein PilV [Thalassomonas haliotis]WDE10719.1 type IV pilus modification protein PilV [Thalassomonas haliotis]
MIAKAKISKHGGMTFIEVLIALFILVTGIIGAIATQASAKKGSFDAMQRSLASSLAQDIIERMRINQSSGLFLENYEGTYGAGGSAPASRCNSTANLCTPLEMVANDLYEWEQTLLGSEVKSGSNNLGGLLGATGCISHNNNSVTVVVSWEGRFESTDAGAANSAFASSCGSSNKKRRQIVIQAFIF